MNPMIEQVQILADSSLGAVIGVIIAIIIAIAKAAADKKPPQVPKPWEPSHVPPPMPPSDSYPAPPPLPSKKSRKIPSARQKAPQNAFSSSSIVNTPAPEPAQNIAPLLNAVNATPSRARNLLTPTTLRNALLASEILQPPLGLRE